MATLYHTGTEYTANEITLVRGVPANITSVGVYHDLDPDVIPEVDDFATVTLVDGTSPGNPLADGEKVDVLALIGARVTADLTLAEGDYQRWVLLVTAAEDIIRPVDVLEIK